MGFVKAIVIGMGVLIVAGFIVVAVTLVMRMQGAVKQEGAYSTSVSLPKGAAVVSSQASDGEIVLRLEAAGGASCLLVIDADTGEETGRIQLVPEGP